MGLCFGGGQLGLGGAALVLGLGTLWGLKYVEKMMRQDARASLILTISRDGPSDEEIRALIAQGQCTVISWGILYTDHGKKREVHGEIQRRVLPNETSPPNYVASLAVNPHVGTIQWRPQGMSDGSAATKSEPKGTPTSLSEPK